ncbi:PEP-CTERM sorting domain-containing protein [Paucibacter sp. M5-1]|uniref:PEP-CTERM sorting domain-containing protein n=1 Tax=Paucibacter sp. M5-1 TaxID=3015998 RepID=UPI0022B86E67|nr:PEP-CTERM sorting domain-containing protein [Paucibacter sp. M5-1]MCZ7883413.1 PEP-CTERM sorting domain-containing protein [Paucibacter sp. M5-1]
MSYARTLLSMSALMGLPLLAQATVLPFTSTFGSGGLASYGDRITGSSQDGASYSEGAGWTPDVELVFATLGGGGPATLWSSGYASLTWALGHGSFDVPYQIDFVPDAGVAVTLRGFDIATWSSGSYATDIRVWDDNGSFAQPNLLSFAGTLSPQTLYQPLSAPVTGTGTVRLYLSNLGSTGLDNVSFTQSPVPEPGTLLLMGAGLAALAARRAAARHR